MASAWCKTETKRRGEKFSPLHLLASSYFPMPRHHFSGQLGEFLVVITCVLPQETERPVRGHVTPFSQDPLGLLDDHPAAQCGFKLPVDKLLLADRSFL